MNAETDIYKLVSEAFGTARVPLQSINLRQFPGELIVIVEVDQSLFDRALQVANTLDDKLPNGFVTVRRSQAKEAVPRKTITSINDTSVTRLLELLNARSRTSEQQPSLRYVKDAAHNLNIAMAPRHHLIFGRRGVGKTALMLEAKKLVEEAGASVLWMNIQSMRFLNARDAFLTVASRICDLPSQIHMLRSPKPLSLERGYRIAESVRRLLSENRANDHQVALIIPELQQLLRLVGTESQSPVFLFFDDIHYLASKELPSFLDMVHAVTRDNAVWIKAAGIKHQSRWFTDNPPLGLQTGHDAAIINLDVTLEEPAKAKAFLSSILRTYTDEVGMRSWSGFLSSPAFDRLVLASGGVPRDFLILSATAVQVARQRAKARSAGVQDVNEAAGRTAKIKRQELEDDAASSVGSAQSRLNTLNVLRSFLIDERQITYFRIDFADKEDHSEEYKLMQSLMDLRMIHLINASLSDEHHAGRRSEVYMLDLSEFSGARFKHNLRVLDFIKNHLALKNTGSKEPVKHGDTPKGLLAILRRGPIFDLTKVSQDN